MSEQPRSRRSQQAILDAAARVIMSQGVPNTSIAEISAESGLSTGAIYHHFPNKQAIVIELTRRALALPKDALLAYRDQPSSPELIFRLAIEALRSDHDLGDLLMQLGAGAATDDELGHELRARFTELRDLVDQTLQDWAADQGIDSARVEGMTQILYSLVLGYNAQRIFLKELFDHDSYATLGSIMLQVPGAAGTTGPAR